MKKTDVVQPVAMSSAFAEGVYSTTGTDDFEIPAATSTAADDSCVLDDGFLPITSTALDNGGKAPERKNFNGMFYLSTDQRFYLQNGGFITYNPDVATAIGGYPKDAVLGYINSQNVLNLVRSLVDDNQYNFLTNPEFLDTYWEVIPLLGGKQYLNNQRVTHCLLEVPQDINLELSNGTLTLKAGSKVYVPNGFETDGTTQKFDEVTIESDKTFSTTSNGTHFLTLNGQGNLAYNSVSLATSGTVAPTSAGYWYNTTDNIIRYYNGSAVIGQYSLPIAIFTVTDDVISSIVQVFNGFGFIGASTFALPGVKMLGPNGRNTDGTLNNYNRNYTSVKVRHESNTQSGNLISLNSGLGRFAKNAWLEGLKKDMPATVSNTGRWEYYATDENLVYTTSGSTTADWTQVNYFLLGTIEGDGTRFTGMTVKQALQLVDYNSLQEVDCIVETYVNGNSWYRIWSDGWCEQGGQTGSYDTNPQTINLLKNYSNTSYSVHCTQNGSNVRAYTMGVTSKTTSSFKVYSGYATNTGVGSNAGNSSTCWYTCGYIGG